MNWTKPALVFSLCLVCLGVGARPIPHGQRAGNSSLTVSWTQISTLNADGSAATLTDQRVYYDTTSRMGTDVGYANWVSVGSTSATSQAVTGLHSGVTYCFAAVAVTATGIGNPGPEVCATAP